SFTRDNSFYFVKLAGICLLELLRFCFNFRARRNTQGDGVLKKELNLSDVEVGFAVFGSEAHLEKQALATVILFTAHYTHSFGFLLNFYLTTSTLTYLDMRQSYLLQRTAIETTPFYRYTGQFSLLIVRSNMFSFTCASLVALIGTSHTKFSMTLMAFFWFLPSISFLQENLLCLELNAVICTCICFEACISFTM
ncbi:hypothetical protein ACJX0J_011518, partial [Zea mays]